MDFSPTTPDSIIITIVYTILLFWGVWVGVRQVYQGFRRPQQMLNPQSRRRRHGSKPTVIAQLNTVLAVKKNEKNIFDRCIIP